MWSLKTETVPVVIGAPGLVKKGVGQYLKKKKIIHSFKIIIIIIYFFNNKNDTKLYS